VKRVLVLALLIFFPWLAAGDPPDDYPFVSFDQGLKTAKMSNKPIFLYFGRFGCAWCAHTNKATFSDPDLRKTYVDHYVLVYVDAESYKRITLPSGERISEAELGTRLKALATPVFVYMTPQGDVIFKAPGFKTVQDLKDFDRYIMGGYYRTQPLLEFLGKKR
jgi:thioredoxin-related protein